MGTKTRSLTKKEKVLKNRRNNLKARYNMTIEEYEELRESQDYRCAICDTHESKLNRPLFVDHNHDTGKVRGLLCLTCNSGIGLLDDDPALCLRAVEYLSG